MLIYNDRAVLSMNESTMIHSNEARPKVCAAMQYELNTIAEAQNTFDALIECDFTEAAVNAGLISESVGTILLQEQSEGLIARFFGFLKKVWDTIIGVIKDLINKVVRFVKEKILHMDSSYSAKEITAAFIDGDFSHKVFPGYITWNEKEFEQITPANFRPVFKELGTDIPQRFNNSRESEAAGNITFFFNKLPGLKGKNATVNNYVEILNKTFIKSEGDKKGFTTEEKTNLVKFFTFCQKLQSELDVIRREADASYNGVNAALKDFLKEREVQDSDGIIAAGIKKAKELITRKVKHANAMVSAFQTAMNRYFNAIGGIITKAIGNMTVTVKSGGLYVLHEREKKSPLNRAKNKIDEKVKEHKEKKEAKKKEDQNKAQNESAIFDDDDMSLDEALMFLEQDEIEYDALMMNEFAV